MKRKSQTPFCRKVMTEMHHVPKLRLEDIQLSVPTLIVVPM